MIRHGQSEKNARLSLSKDSRLTPLGREEARRTAAALLEKRIRKLYCSPQQRALETAAILAQAWRCEVEVWVALAEKNFSGEEHGLRRSEILARFPGFRLPPEVDEEGWARHWQEESNEELSRRMLGVATMINEWAAGSAALGAAQEAAQGTAQEVAQPVAPPVAQPSAPPLAPPATIACVIHGTSGNALLRHLLGIKEEGRIRFRLQNCSITRLVFEPEGVLRVYSLNEVHHLDGLAGSADLTGQGGPVGQTGLTDPAGLTDEAAEEIS